MDAKLIIGLTVIIILGIAMVPTLKSFCDDAKLGGDKEDPADDITGMSALMLDLIPLFYIIGLLLAVIGWAKIA